MSSGLHAQVRLQHGDFTLDAALDVPAGEVLAVVGPNGCGKSTLLRAVAGLAGGVSGVVTVAGRCLTDSAGGVLVPAAGRRVGLLAQDARLFPHLSVLENVAFGPRSTGQRPARARRLARVWLDRVEMSGFARRRPGALSGGQAQRVALARALAAEPEVLLLDEPLAALDAQSAPVIRQLIADEVRSSGTTTVVVSHNVLDAVVLADRIAVLHEGTVAERGPVPEVLGSPRTPFTAALAGTNLLPGTVDAAEPLTVHTSWGRWQGVPDPQERAAPPDVGDRCVIRIRPSAVVLSSDRPTGPNAAAATVRWLEPSDVGVRVRLAGAVELVAQVDLGSADPTWLHPGARVWAQVQPAQVRVGTAGTDQSPVAGSSCEPVSAAGSASAPLRDSGR